MEVKSVCAEKTDLDPSKYKGMYRDLKVDVKKECANLRDEWERK